MARNRQASFAKRKREQARQEKASQKRGRRGQRAQAKKEGYSHDQMDADVSHFTKPTEDEVAQAVENAMNPGKAGRRSRSNEASTATLFVGNVDYDVEDQEIQAAFQDAGFDVQMVRIGRDRTTGVSRGFAFVELGSPVQAGEALDKMQGLTMRGRELRLSPAEKGKGR